jgi:thiosulfate/3-mercaptopyruvate sulfurtransferase
VRVLDASRQARQNLAVNYRILACVTFVISCACFAGDQGVDTATVPHATPVPEAQAPTEFVRADALIDTEALAKLIDSRDPKLVVIDARNEENYGAGHLPGARNIPSDSFQDPSNLPSYLANSETVKNTCAETGIGADSHVVIYDDDDSRLAARVWFTLHAYGHDHLSILNGGVQKWRNEEHAWATDAAPAKKGSFQPADKLRGICTFDDLPQFKMRVHTIGVLPSVTMIDARGLQEYMGEEVRGKVGGHIPGSANLEWCNVLTAPVKNRVWRSAPEIHAILRLAGIDRTQKIAVYDQAGGRSAHLYFTLWIMGFDQAFNYVGGWREYSKKDGVEIEK